MNLLMPRWYITPEQAPNAFAAGRDPRHSALALTAGILKLMNESELEGVVAEELGHVLHCDILISSVAATHRSAAQAGYVVAADSDWRSIRPCSTFTSFSRLQED